MAFVDVLEVREDEECQNEQNQRDNAAAEINVTQDHCSADLLQHIIVIHCRLQLQHCGNE